MNDITATTTQRPPRVPSPYTDRSSLSEAWYRALYGTQPNRGPSRTAAQASRPVATSAAADESGGARASRSSDKATMVNAVARGARSIERPILDVATYRILRKPRDAAQPVAQRTWRAPTARRLTCNVALPNGSTVDLLVQQRGRHVHVLALTDDDAAREEAALQRAHAALALAGIRIDVVSRRKGQS